MIQPTKGAKQLLLEGSQALSQVEANGIRIDVDYLDDTMQKVEAKINRLTAHLKSSSVWKEWRQAYREEANLDGRQQLGDVLFNKMGFPCAFRTKTGKPSTSERSLESVSLPFVRDYFKRAKLMKLHSTYFKNVRREVQDGFVRPSFPLNLVSSYRSSSQNPNFQNQPTRDPKIAKLIRSAFVPREGNVLVEIDYVAAEVRCAACYHLDPTMIKYIETGYDLHRDMAAECFKMPKDQVTKGVRYLGKNGFVFPAFYGSWYLEIAQNLWDAAAKEEGLRDHLRSQGIDGLGACDPQQAPREGSFEAHMKGVCDNFWGQRFPVYDEWRNDWFRKYQERGWFKSLTGFVYSGIYKRNEVINYPVQGSAFHWLLWDLIQIQKKIHKTGALIVGQIHDSLLLDVPRHALEDVVALVQDVMCVQVRKHWGWIIVPLDIEVEVGEKNWYEKVEYGVDN